MSVYAHLIVIVPFVGSVAFLGGLAVVTACDRMLHR